MTNKQAATKIIKILRDKGFQALLAGGCVRDMFLGRRAKDYDIATSANPQEVISLFRRTLKIGAKFGVIMVLIDDQRVEVATFRTESDYADGRHPSKVVFADAQADASRRDFTINAMYYDPIEDEAIDFFDGRADLSKGVIRTVGKPDRRFGEDYLRMLRAIRFSTQLDFKIAPDAWSAIQAGAGKITKISSERITMELEAILIDPNRSLGVTRFIDSGLACAIFKDAQKEDIKKAAAVLANLPEKVDFALALAAFFSLCGTDSAIKQSQALRLSKALTNHLQFLLENRGKLLEELSLSDLKLLLAEPCFEDLFSLQKALEKAKTSTEGLSLLKALRRRINKIADIDLKPPPLLNGHDLIKLGAISGPRLGQLAREMYIAQLEGQLKTRPQAKKWVSAWLDKHNQLK